MDWDRGPHPRLGGPSGSSSLPAPINFCGFVVVVWPGVFFTIFVVSWCCCWNVEDILDILLNRFLSSKQLLYEIRRDGGIQCCTLQDEFLLMMHHRRHTPFTYIPKTPFNTPVTYIGYSKQFSGFLKRINVIRKLLCVCLCVLDDDHHHHKA